MAGKDTLDHRTVVGTILGAASVARGARESLADALERVRGFAPALIDDHHAALVEAFEVGREDPDLAEAAVLLGLADQEVAARRGLDVLGYGLWAARAHARAGRAQRAIELADLLTANGVLSGELTALQGECLTAERRRRRQRDQALLCARRALATEQIEQARAHFARALELDPACGDAAEALERLALEEATGANTGRRARLAFFAVLALALPVGAVSMAHVRASQEYERFERPVPSDLLSIERRIAELETFRDAHPLWWGSGRVEHELFELARARDAVESELRERNFEAEAQRQAALARVDAIYLEARTAVEAGRPHAALALLEGALADGVPSAATRSRLRRDIAAIRELLAEGGTAGEGVARR